MKPIEQLIVDTAKSFVGQEEIRGNLGFKEERFQQLMEATGWEEKQAWCAYFGELVWRLAYGQLNSLIAEEVEKLFSGSAVATYRNFVKDGTFERSVLPIPGSLVIWQRYKDGKAHWTGHLGICVKGLDKTFYTVEGNTNDKGTREGYMVAERIRTYNWEEQNGLRLIGFVIPKPI